MNELEQGPALPRGISSSLRYRPDIDGLRAIAVLPVVLFHAGLGFSGGYVGVDIFFVISGYLISLVLLRDWERGKYSIALFYERRVRRIIPALFVVIAFCFAISLGLLIPKDFYSFSTSVVATTTFLSNIAFYEQSGYFATAAHYKPLLHTWSLAVEEQFYILYPPLLWLSLKYARKILPWLILSLLALSLAASEVAVWLRPDAAFYLSPFRAWELLVGCFLALDVLPRLNRAIERNLLATAATFLIAYAVFFYSSDTPFPGLSALLPCLGAAGLIYSNSLGKTFVGDVLSSRPFVFIGQISYSLYLWHWPLLVCARLFLFRPLTRWEGLEIAVLSVVVAAISWRFVERPFRQATMDRRRVFVVASSGAAALLALGISGLLSDGFPRRYDPKVVALAGLVDSTQTHDWLSAHGMSSCFQGENHVDPTGIARCMTPVSGRKNILVWGDSHAAYAFPGVWKMARGENLGARLVSLASCTPTLSGSETPSCFRFVHLVAAQIEPKRYNAVVLFGHWFGWERHWHSEQRRRELFQKIDQTISLIHAKGIRVILVGPLPEYDEPLPVILARQLAMHSQYLNAQDHLEHGLFSFDQDMRARFHGIPGVIYVSALDAVCPGRKCQTQTATGVPVEADASHFSVAGSIAVARSMLMQPITNALR